MSTVLLCHLTGEIYKHCRNNENCEISEINILYVKLIK